MVLPLLVYPLTSKGLVVMVMDDDFEAQMRKIIFIIFMMVFRLELTVRRRRRKNLPESEQRGRSVDHLIILFITILMMMIMMVLTMTVMLMLTMMVLTMLFKVDKETNCFLQFFLFLLHKILLA